MLKVKIPDFLKPLPGHKPSKICLLIKEYEKRFGKTWSTEEFGIEKTEELENIFETCLRENRSFYDVIGMSPDDLDEDDEF